MSAAPPDPFLRTLRRRRGAARAVIFFERLWPALWPAFGILGAFLCAALLGLPPLLPAWAHAGLLAAIALLVVGLLARGLRGLSLADAAAADRRLEQASGLAHHPLATLADRPAQTDGLAMALWQAHRARARAALSRLRIGLPHPGLATRDRLALRGALVVGLVACLAIAGADAPARLVRALTPGFAPWAAAPGTEIAAWITPPAYTRLPPLLLRPEQRVVSVPNGSRLSVSVTGGHGAPRLSLAGQNLPFRRLDAGSFQAKGVLHAGGTGASPLALRRNGSRLAAWMVTVRPDMAPTAAFTAPPGAAADGQSLRLPWQAADAYGVTSLQARIRLDARPHAAPLVVQIPLPGNQPRAPAGVQISDLTANPWAGLPVTMRLVARNAIGLRGTSAPAHLALPERHFTNPLARALMAIRRQLSLDPGHRSGPAHALAALADNPVAYGSDTIAFLAMADTTWRLMVNHAAAAVPQAQQTLWELALHLEEGPAARTAAALNAARRALQDALNSGHATPRQMANLVRALERALARHLAALAKQAQQAGQPDQAAHKLDPAALARQFARMEQEAKAGRMNAVRQRLAALQNMLRALEQAQMQPPMDPRAQAALQQGRQQMQALQKLLQREAGLLNKAEQRAAGPPQARNAPQPGEAATQSALRRALQDLMGRFGALTGQKNPPPGLGAASKAMQGAAQALGQGRNGAALAAERQAIAALQQGGQQMARQMAGQFGPPNGQGQGLALGPPSRGETPGQYGGRNGQDPFGRTTGTMGGIDTGNDVTIPMHMRQTRIRALLDELRKRVGEPGRSHQERDYIERLIKPF
ncbi:MAG TPA: DUF4175 family protein [Acetobacteraceae bacterium]|nr:DUF4175 family protein [Acetobacteraceae bacterium]